MVWPAFSNLSGIDPWKTKCSNCESDENRHREKKLKGVEGKIAQHKKEMESKKRQEDKLLFTLFSCQQKFLFNSNFFIFCLSFSQITCSSIRFKWLGHCEVREEESWGIHTDRARQRQSICMPCGGKRCWLGRLWVPIHDSSRSKKAADQARWVLPDRWSTLITHCLGGRHLSDKWEAQCCLNLWRSRRLGQALWQQQQETKKTELQLQPGQDVNNLREPETSQAPRPSESHCQKGF